MSQKFEKYPEQFSFAKSLSGKYLFVSENLAEAAGFDSSSQMIGLHDSDLIWRAWSDILSKEDYFVAKGNVLTNHPFTTKFADNPDKILYFIETKTVLRNSRGRVIGVIGSAINVTEHRIVKSIGSYNQTGERFTLTSGIYSGLVFSKKQVVLLQYLVMGYSATDIASILNRSKRTIEGHIEHLKNKFQCLSKSEIIRCVVTSGFLNGLDWPVGKNF